MSYKNQLKKSANWLYSIRNEDNGWGLVAGQASSIVNTAEAIYVLGKANQSKYRSYICDGLKFIQEKTLNSVTVNSKTRYVYFALLACLNHLDHTDRKFLNYCARWLLDARNKDGAWGHTANDEESRLYPTVMAIIVLSKLQQNKELQQSCNWLISKSTTNGWKFSDDQQVSPIATAQAVVALRCFKPAADDLFVKAKELLLMTSVWGVESEDMPGTPWVHNSQMWIFEALTELDIEPYAKPIAEGVREMNKLNTEKGWQEFGNHTTVRGQYWAVCAFQALKQAFDPAKHPYWIDSALSNSEMREPDFVRISPHSKWSFAVPKVAYQTVAYLMFVFSIGAFVGLHHLTQTIPRQFELLLAIIGFAATYLLVFKRRTLFPKWIVDSVIGVVTLLSCIDLIFGYSVNNIFDFFTTIINGIMKK